MEEYIRNCPKCNLIIVYRDKYTLKTATNNSGLCKSCTSSNRIRTKEWNDNISKSQKGIPRWSDEQKIDIGKQRRLYFTENDVWNKGLTKETNNTLKEISKKLSVLNLGKTYEEIHGFDKAKSIKEKKASVYHLTVDKFIAKYGVSHPMQSPEIYSKSKKGRYKFKQYQWPSGNISEVQGYEPYALNILLETFNEIDIIVEKDKMPPTWYYLEDGIKLHRYFPDIWIPSENKFIEVKSVFTFNLDKEYLYYKSKAIKESGYQFEIWVIENKKIKQVI